MAAEQPYSREIEMNKCAIDPMITPTNESNLSEFLCPVRYYSIRFPDNIAVYLADKEISYALLDSQVNQACKQLAKKNLCKGHYLAFCAENSIEHVVLLFACLRMQINFCALSTRYSEIEKKEYLKDAGIDHLIQQSPISWSTMSSLIINENNDINSEIECSSKFKEKDIAISPQAPYTITFTSGSSGVPKAAVHNYHNHYFSALGSCENIPLLKDDCWLASLPFYHVGGLAIIMRSIISGASIAILPGELQQTLKQNKITHASLVPTQLYRLLKSYKQVIKQSSLRYLLLGGAPIKAQTLMSLKALGIQSFYSYGLTEMSSQVATKRADQDYFTVPLPYRQWRVVNDELQVKGDTLFMGYLKNKTIIKATQDGWFYTKDLVSQENSVDDANSDIQIQDIKIIGRKDNMFICGGENYQPETVEKVINQFDKVKNVVIVGLNDDDLGKKAVAFIDWCDENNKPHFKELEAYLRQRISAIKIPKVFLSWPHQALDKNAKQSLKINRKQFTQIAMEITSAL